MTLAQIMSIIALLVAFEAPPEVVQNVQTVLLEKVTVERVTPTVVFNEPITQEVPMRTLEVHHTINGPYSKDDKNLYITFTVFALEDDRQLLDEEVTFIAPDKSEKTVTTSIVGRVFKHDPSMHKGSQFYWQIPIGESREFIFRWGEITKTVKVNHAE